MTYEPLLRMVFPTPGPLFCRDEGPVDKACLQVQSAPLSQIFGQGLQDPLQHPGSHPPLEPTVAGLV